MISTDEIERCFNAVRQSKMIVVDTETSGLDWKKSFVAGYVFSVGPSKDMTWYLPVRHGGGGNIPGCSIPASADSWSGDLHWIEKRIAEEIGNRTDLHVIGHNLKFDLHMCKNHGISFNGTVEDTRVNQALINENQGKYSLDFCATGAGVAGKATDIYEKIVAYCKAAGIPCKPNEDSMENFWRLHADEGEPYATQDGETTWLLRNWQMGKILEEQLDRVWSLEKRVTNVLYHLERRGVQVDESRLIKVQEKLIVALKNARIEFPNLNVRSPKQVKAIFDAAGITDYPSTEKGSPSFKEEWLELSELGNKVLDIRRIENLTNTFIEGSIRHNLYKGRIHTNFNQVATDGFGVITGRLSSNGPNMQQIKKRDKILSPMLRQLYRPRNGLIWLSADYKSQEYRVFGQYSGAKFVLDAYDNDPDTDYHQLVADLLGVERDPTAKRINLGTIYGMGYKKLAKSLNCSLAQAKEYLTRLKAMMPEAAGFMDEAERRVIERGYVCSILGRRRRITKQEGTRKAGNAVIQSTCADITKLKMAEIDEFLIQQNSRTRMILQVHDSLEFEHDPEEEEIRNEVIRIAQSFGDDDIIKLRVPMRMDVGMGESWGHATFGNKYKDWI